MLELALAIVLFIIGLIGIACTSKIAVHHAASLASMLGVSNFIIGITVVSIGTDISEIFNSIIACSLGHGDIDIGDSVGSVLTQITLIFGLLAVICGNIKMEGNRWSFFVTGACLLLALFMLFNIVEKGFYTRIDALFLIISFVFFLAIIYHVTRNDTLIRVDLMIEDVQNSEKSKRYHATVACIAFIGVAISSFVIINSLITISTKIGVPEYIISFLLVSIGTSLPELIVDIQALRMGKSSMAVGDILGSCLVDATLSVSIGQLLFPQAVTAGLAVPTIFYTILATSAVLIIVLGRRVVDKKASAIFFAIYGLSFLIFSII